MGSWKTRANGLASDLTNEVKHNTIIITFLQYYSIYNQSFDWFYAFFIYSVSIRCLLFRFLSVAKRLGTLLFFNLLIFMRCICTWKHFKTMQIEAQKVKKRSENQTGPAQMGHMCGGPSRTCRTITAPASIGAYISVCKLHTAPFSARAGPQAARAMRGLLESENSPVMAVHFFANSTSFSRNSNSKLSRNNSFQHIYYYTKL